MDAIDRRIVAELQAAPRLRVAELARRIGLSSQPSRTGCAAWRRAAR